MQRRWLWFPVSAVVALLGAGVAGAQTVDEIVARNIQAKGGLDKIRSVQAMKQIARFNNQGMEAILTVYSRRPNLVRQEMAIGGRVLVMAFDGTQAWSQNPFVPVRDDGTPKQAPDEAVLLAGPSADQAKDQADFEGPLVDYKAKGSEIELVGTESVGDRRAYHLKITPANKRIIRCYIDVETGLEIKIVTESAMGAPIEQELSDYRDVSGLKIPFKIRSVAGGMVQGQISIEKIEINPTVDDAIFRMPKK